MCWCCSSGFFNLRRHTCLEGQTTASVEAVVARAGVRCELDRGIVWLLALCSVELGVVGAEGPALCPAQSIRAASSPLAIVMSGCAGPGGSC